MKSEIGQQVYRTSRGEPISSHRVTATDTEDTFCLSDVFGESTDVFGESTDTVDLADTVARACLKADAAERRRYAEQLDALRAQLLAPLTAGRFSEIAQGGHGPSSLINTFFSDGEAE